VQPNDAQFLECLTAQSKLSMANGALKNAEDIQVGDLVLGWDLQKLVPSRVSYVGENGVRDVIRITTHRGRVLTATANHPYFASKRQRCEKCGRNHIEKSTHTGLAGRWYKAEELSVGDYVRVGLGYSFDGEMPEETAWLLGVLIGDGHLKNERQISFTNIDKGVISHTQSVAKLHGFELRYQSGCKYNFAGGGYGAKNTLRHFIRTYNLAGLRSHTKKVPDAVLYGGKSAWVGFLSGLIDTDGTVRPETAKQPLVRIDSVSRELLSVCQHLFALLGIQSALVEEEQTYKGELGIRYGLSVCGRSEVAKAAQVLNCHHVEKRRRLNVWAQHMPSAREHEDFFLFDRVVSVEQLLPERTISIEIEGTHTHVTNGLITHNSRQFQIDEVCRWFRVTAQKVANLMRATFNNVEHLDIAHVKDTLVPWVTRLEQEADLKLFGANRQNLFSRINVNSLLRGDFKSRNDAYSVGRNGGWLTPNDIRRLEDMDPIESEYGDSYLAPVNNRVIGQNGNVLFEPTTATGQQIVTPSTTEPARNGALH